MKRFVFLISFSIIACSKPVKQEEIAPQSESVAMTVNKIELTLENAEKLSTLPFECIQVEYPNKLDHVISSSEDIQNPKTLHPAFYGCFDWHSSVHGHWSLIRILKQFPDLPEARSIRQKLLQNISKENIQTEVEYFSQKAHKSSERTYGWAWLLKLSEELENWDDNDGKQMKDNLQPLTDLIVKYYKEFLPKLTKPIRVGEHQNTAFALVFAYDYAKAVGDEDFIAQITTIAKDFYLNDVDCPINYEPGGFDFLSPCLEEIDIMSRVLNKNEFHDWLQKFMPEIYEDNFNLEPGKVSDREDGKLVHLDGVNFSRAWVFYELSSKFNRLKHLENIAHHHFNYSFENILEGDSYMGSHWLGSFALYALDRSEKQN